MKLYSPKIIKQILEKHQIKPSKSLGQNFLIDKNILDKIINAGELKKDDVVLEVGPGIGILTRELAKNAGQVIAVEKDRDMINILTETLAEFKNVEIIEADILSYKVSSLSSYKVVANIPYYLTSHLIRILLESKNPPKEIVMLIQKEVAQRICPPARTGQKSPHMNLLAVSVQFYATPKIISYVSKNCFLPAPKIDSAIIKITPFPKTVRCPTSYNFMFSSLRGGPQADEAIQFFKIVKAGFSQARKQLANNFSKNLKMKRENVEAWLAKNNIKPNQRAETLSMKDWKNLAESFPHP